MKKIVPLLSTAVLALIAVTASAEPCHPLHPGGKILMPPSCGEEIVPCDKNQDSVKPVTLILHQENNGAKVTVPVGSIVKIILETQAASTGFEWNYALLSPDVLAFQNKNMKNCHSPLIGAPHQEVWTFQAITPGKTALIFSLSRSWEQSPVAKTVLFDITAE